MCSGTLQRRAPKTCGAEIRESSARSDDAEEADARRTLTNRGTLDALGSRWGVALFFEQKLVHSIFVTAVRRSSISAARIVAPAAGVVLYDGEPPRTA